MLGVTSPTGFHGQHVLTRTGVATVHKYASNVSLPSVLLNIRRTNYGATPASTNQNGGCAIIPFISNGEDTKYCCDAVVANGTQAACAHGHEFTLHNGAAIPGRAYLAKDSVTGNNKNNKDVAIGAGVGVPLGVLFLTALGWALYERKRRYALLNSPAAASFHPMQPENGQNVVPQGVVAPVPIQELEMTERQNVQELDGQSKR